MDLWLLSLILATVFTIVCGGSFKTAALLVALPEYEGPHDSGIEWWYFNGRFTDDRGQEYSYHYVTFQSESAGAVGASSCLYSE